MSLKEQIDRKFGVITKIKMGVPGSLDVLVDGNILFSAKAAKRMPASGEVLELIAARAGTL